MYRSIVVGTDGSATAQLAVSRAAHLARAGESPTVHVVSAYQPLTHDQITYLRDAVPEQYRDEVRADMGPRGALADAAATLDRVGVTYVAHDRHGDPAEAILDVAEEVGADLIVVWSRGLGAGQRLMMGSVSSTLSHDAPIDVLVARTTELDEAETVTSALGRLREAVDRFETDHPDLTRTVNDVSYYLSGLGI